MLYFRLDHFIWRKAIGN